MEIGMSSSPHAVSNPACVLRDLGFGAWGLRFGVCGVGVEMWGVVFGVWDLGFWVWGLGGGG